MGFQPSASLTWVALISTCPPLLAQDSASRQFDAIPWETGPVLGNLGSEAEVSIPQHCLFTRGDGVRQFMELTQNTTNPNERGVAFCGLESDSRWFVVFTFDPSGYVKDDERDQLDADAILGSIRDGMERGNEERVDRGWPPLNVDRWRVAPYYDLTSNNLTWATEISASDGSRSVNHSVRLLGRGGVMHVDLVVDPEDYDSVTPVFGTLVTGFAFRSGHQYSEWRSGDKIAEYGLTALVAGGAGAVAAKSGVLGKLWKIIVAAGALGLAWLRNLFRGRKPKEDPATG